MSKIGAIIQARMGSARLPGKVLMPLVGKPVVQHVVERLTRSKTIDKIIVATSTNEIDDILAKFLKTNGISFFRGDEDDVLDRFYQCAKKFKLDVIIRITSDCPFVDAQLVDEIVNYFLTHKGKLDYTANVNPPTYPDGLDVEVFSFAALEKSWKEAKLQYQREHVTSFIRDNPQIFKNVNITYKRDLSNVRLTLDTAEDFIVVSNIYNSLYSKNPKFNWLDVINLIEANPEILNPTKHIKRDEKYWQQRAEQLKNGKK